jgi:hypothetical protein
MAIEHLIILIAMFGWQRAMCIDDWTIPASANRELP